MIKYIDKKSVYIEDTVVIGNNCIIYPNVIMEGNTVIGDNCIIMHGSYIKDSIIGSNNKIYTSYIVNTQLGYNNEIGPYANLHSRNDIGNNNRIGSFIELKENKIGNGNKIAHLSYLGDATLEDNIHIGSGVATVNKKFNSKLGEREKTFIESNSFIGCNVNLVAPIRIGKYGFVGAGSTITNDVSSNSLVLERSKEIVKENYL